MAKEVCCDLEVDVNGEEIFLVNKRLLSKFSGRLSKLFGKSTGIAGKLKVIFHDLPGGAHGFELITRFCYNNGKIEITPSNISLLHFVSHFMEMNKDIYGPSNLLEKTEKTLEGINYWTWSELISALKQCQAFISVANSSGVFQKYLDSLVAKLATSSAINGSPITSPESSDFRFSCDTRSSESVKLSYSKGNWWFEDLLVLNPILIEKVIKSMVLQKLDHLTISKFLFYYQKSRFLGAMGDEKLKIIETVVDMLFSLNRSSISCKGLFQILQVSSNLKVSKLCRKKLEKMTGSQLDQATLDNLLVPSPPRKHHLYDVNIVLRFLKSFLHEEGYPLSSIRLKKVAKLMDLYIAEVAPDFNLTPSKFLALTMALPDSARDCHDGIYRAMDMYLEVHSGLSEEENMKICCALNYEKLSFEALEHLSQNLKFSYRTEVQAKISQQFKLKSLIHGTNHLNPCSNSQCSFDDKGRKWKKNGESDQLVLHAKNLDFSMENENLRENLQGMQRRVMELEKVCKKMQTQMEKLMKSRLSSPISSRSLPKMCS